MENRKKTATVRIVFDRRHTATMSYDENRRPGTVYVEVYYGGRRVYFPTGVRVYLDQFKNGRVCNRGRQGQMNELIRKTADAIEEYVNNMQAKGQPLSLDALKEYMSDASVCSDNSFLDFMHKSIRERDVSESTRYKHFMIWRRLKEWGHIRSFSDVTVEGVMAWHRQAVTVAVKSDFTVNYDRVLKIYVRLAVSKGLLKDNPYDHWCVPKYTPAQTHRNISLEDLRKIEGVSLDDEYEIKARDLFVFQANTGLSYADTQNFDVRKVRKEGGRVSYEGTRVKTTEAFYVPLNDKAKTILKRHGGRPPELCLEVYNVDIKRVAGKAGVHTPLSSHWARHTFAMICVNNGMSIEALARILGHSNIKTTQIYAEMKKDFVNEQFDNVMKRIGGDGELPTE